MTVKSYKLLGYCPYCFGMISGVDLEKGKKSIINCWKCGSRCSTKELSSDKPIKVSEIKDKKKYLDAIVKEASEIDINKNIPEEYLNYNSGDEWD
jgi:transcription elongation factor Elf1